MTTLSIVMLTIAAWGQRLVGGFLIGPWLEKRPVLARAAGLIPAAVVMANHEASLKWRSIPGKFLYQYTAGRILPVSIGLDGNLGSIGYRHPAILCRAI